ncbi:hypothetical protein [Actinorugispora endophytica]|uniref:Uncharacterized protein n=1 Tax=Actinorugispora endophytica TaxID=1605990 RepID=A0A4R6UYC4_9ACTN|nr:hypothetical protein [Actinorugispora endophytica]TDQ52510.1 hypothetical protein EV190_106148 [Actinorugispora endophytica]
MAQPNRDQGGSSEVIDDALRLVDALQRKLIIAGVRRGVASVTSPPPRKGDVWEQAVKEEPRPDGPVLDQVIGIARDTLPELGRHLGAAGSLVFGAMGRTLTAVERSLQQKPATGASSGKADGDVAPAARAD